MFSVVIPVWNKRDTIAAAVASVLAQSCGDFELIVVDDGSTDGSMDRLRAFDDPRLRTVAQANAGPGPARNRGIEEAGHDWIAFLDADDLWLPDHLAELARIRGACPEAGLIGTAYALREHQGHCHLPDEGAGPRIEIVDYFRQMGEGQNLLCASSAAIPRGTYARMGPFTAAPGGEDSEYWARIALDLPVAVSRRVTALYLQRADGRSVRNAEARLEGDLLHPGDLSPVVDLLVRRYPTLASADLRRAVGDYLDFRFGLRARAAARIGDFRTLRALPGFYLRSPRPRERLIFALARLPRPLARTAYRAGFRVKALLRALDRRSRRLRLPDGHVD